MSKKSRERAQRHAARAAGIEVPARPARAAVPLTMARQCGSCRACCVVFDVHELDKPRGVPCVHLKPETDAAGMCGIWADPEKPAICAEFRCEWLKGNVPEDLYPGACNVVFRPTKDGLKFVAFELTADAARLPVVNDFIATIVDAGVPVIVIPPCVPGQPEPLRRLIQPTAAKNPAFRAELEQLKARNPGTFIPAPPLGIPL